MSKLVSGLCFKEDVKLNAKENVERALMLAQTRLAVAPEYRLFDSIVNQLKYLLSALTGGERDNAKLRQIIVGRYAVQEFEQSDPEFADALMIAQDVASKMAEGLKV